MAPGNCHYAIEATATDEEIFTNFDTDCPGRNMFSVPPGALRPGVTYIFWVELTAGDGGTSATTAGLNNFTYFQGATNSSWIEFTVSQTVAIDRFRRGDCNDDGVVDLSDAVCILDWLFAGGADPSCDAAVNTNGDKVADVSDSIYLLLYLFAGGPPPAAPFPDCGPDPAVDDLTCESFGACQ